MVLQADPVRDHSFHDAPAGTIADKYLASRCNTPARIRTGTCLVKLIRKWMPELDENVYSYFPKFARSLKLIMVFCAAGGGRPC